MADNGKLDIRPGPQQPPEFAELTIHYVMATGAVSVGGPNGIVDNRGLCYLMLGLGRDAIHERSMLSEQDPSQQTPDDEPHERRKFGDD